MAGPATTRPLFWTRLAFAVFFVVVAGLTVANLAILVPSLTTSYQNGLSQVFAGAARFRAAVLLADAYLLVVVSGNSTFTGNSTVPAALANISFQGVVSQMEATTAELEVFVAALEGGNATLFSAGFTQPLTSPTISANLAAVDVALGIVVVAVDTIVQEVNATNTSTITPTIAEALADIVEYSRIIVALLQSILAEMIGLSLQQLQSVTRVEIAINIATLASLVLLGLLVYLPMEWRIWHQFRDLLDRNTQLDKQAADLEVLTKLNPNGIIRVDTTGKVTHANKRWFEITGIYGLGSACDRWTDCVHPDDRAAVKADWANAMKHADASFAREFRFVRQDASVAWLVGHTLPELVPASVAGGLPARITSLVSAFTDISGFKSLGQERLAALASAATISEQRALEAEAHQHELEHFVDTICHEIRNPLNGIVNNVDLLRSSIEHVLQRRGQLTVQDGLVAVVAVDACLDELGDAASMLGAIDVCALHQRRITDDVLEISRLHAGRYTLNLTNVWLDDVVSAAMQMFRQDATVAGVTLRCADASWAAAHVRIHADAQRLAQILVNLLSNAVKFTRHTAGTKAVDVIVQLGSDGAALPGGDVLVTIAVRDTGIGMSPEELEGLFVPFTQASSKTYSTYGGSGMGLCIVKELLDLMHGRVTIDSAPGRGTTFTVKIPCRRAAEPSAPATPAPPPPIHANAAPDRPRGGPAPCVRVLVVDDNEINRRVVCKQLRAVEEVRFNLVEAVNGEDALRQALEQPFDAIIMDIEMPVMDGLEATARIREHERTFPRHTPIIGLSGNARQEHRDKALAAGMDDYVVKPYNRADFIKLLLDYIVL